MLDRRSLLTAGASLALTPWARAVRLADPSSDGTLVVLQLSGGNDGLSTVVPYADPAYQRARGTLRFGPGEVLKLGGGRGLHPALTGLRKIWDAGHLAIVEGCGYPDPVRSHFKALEVWHTGSPRGRASGDGWLGGTNRALQGDEPRPEFLVHVGGNAPYSIHSTTHPASSVQSPTAYRWFGESGGAQRLPHCDHEDVMEESRHRGRDRALAQLRQVLADAEESSLRIRAAAARHPDRVEYPRTAIGAQLHDAAAILCGGVGTRVVSTVMGGFDTHANQRNTHDRLMRELDAALAAFYEDLSASDAGRKVTLVVFSEFGRRVQQNGSGGTDHGKAGPMFVIGHRVKGGFHGRTPSLASLDEGDVPFTTDFRSVYATVLERALGADPVQVLGQRWPKLGFLG